MLSVLLLCQLRNSKIHMPYQILAAINANRQITHESGKTIHIHWDDHQFELARHNFVRLVRALEYGSKQPYAGDRSYSVVQVDDELREVWIKDSCLTLGRDEYRALLNAVLTTETRLHGFRVPEPKPHGLGLHVQTIATIRPPRPTCPYWN